jgi:hypothetical protein
MLQTEEVIDINRRPDMAAKHYWFIFRRSWVHILTLRPAVLIGFCGFSQSFQANAGIIPKIGPQLLPYISITIHHSLIIISFNTM